uniref:Phlebovirus glycoprotein G2 fusion domain-containing protein n=1 Tax=Panagrolaimus davidi TaxID=227884 RepID=A0A914QFV6_9BILA
MNKLHPKPWSAVFRRPEGNELVIVEDDDIPKSDWKIAKIVETHLSDDGECRSATVKTANGRELKRSVKHLYPLELSTSLLIVCLISCFIPFAAASKCPKDITEYETVYHENCLKNGYVVMKDKMNKYCWKKLECENDSHIIRSATHAHDDRAYCGDPCKCPDWATTCSFYLNPYFLNSTAINPSTRQLIEHNQPSYCSLNPSPRCSPDKSEKLFYQIELFDGSLHYVNTLTFLSVQVHENSIKCFGEGAFTGTPDYCLHHECHENGTKFCTIQNHEVLMWIGGGGSVEVKAYGLIKVFVYDYPKAQPIKKMKTTCSNGTLKIEYLNVHDRIQIKIRNDQALFLVNETLFLYELPEVYAIKTQKVEVGRINLGNIIDSESVTCEAINICERIKCSFCLISLLNPQCTSEITLIVFSCIVGFVFGILTYPVGQCCRRRYLRKRAPNYPESKSAVIDIEDEPNPDPTGFSFSRDAIVMPLIHHAPAVMCLIGLLMLLQPVQGATKVQVFSAESISCDTTSSGWKSCHFDETTIITMMVNDVAELLLKDDVGRPQQTIRIEVEPVAVCKRFSKGFTRIVKIDVASIKRCPGMGSCVGNYCETLPVTANVTELAVAHQFPGNSFCSEACGGWGCGCPSFDAACLFYKIYAIPITEEPTRTSKECEKNTKTRQIEGVTRENQRFWQKGESITVNRLKIGVKIISTPITSISSLKFVTDGKRIAMLDDISQAAMGLVYCPTKSDAVNLNCTVAMDICSCQPGEKRMNCACRENSMIANLLEHRALPQEKLNVLIVEEDGVLYYPLMESTVEIQY